MHSVDVTPEMEEMLGEGSVETTSINYQIQHNSTTYLRDVFVSGIS